MAGVLSFSGLTVHECCVIGLESLSVGSVEVEEEYFEIRTEWSDKSITYVRRRYYDLVKLVNSLEKLFPEDGRSFNLSATFKAMQKIVEAEENNDIETKLNEVEKLLTNIIKMPPKYSQGEAVFTFFKTSSLDYSLKNMFDPIQPFYESPVTTADVRRANGFCLANTETVLFDAYMLEKEAENIQKCSSEFEVQIGKRFLNGIRPDDEYVNMHHFTSPALPTGALENNEGCYTKKTQVTLTNLTHLYLNASETDILE